MKRCFLTGCDSNTEWQLPWFIANYRKHCKIPLVIANFGMTENMLDQIIPACDLIMDCTQARGKKGWFGKINAMNGVPTSMYKEVCWIDTDCEIISDPIGIFDYIEDNKLAMVEDKPWSKRRGEMGRWHNTGVIAFRNRPAIIKEWYRVCNEKELRGDQEALYWMMGGDELRKMTHITDLPHKYNVLRLDVLDKTVPKEIVIMHHTGQKGNLEIKRKINV